MMLSAHAIRIVKGHTRKKKCQTGEEKRQDTFTELAGPEFGICLRHQGDGPEKEHKPYQYLGDDACHSVHIPSRGQPAHKGFVLQYSFASLTNNAWYSLKRLMFSLSFELNNP